MPTTSPEPEKRKAMCLHCGLEISYTPGDEKDQARAWVALLNHDQKECPKNPLLNEVRAWRERFPAMEYRSMDDCVALKFGN